MKKAFVTGWPIEHSKSPFLHGYWLREHGIEGSYEAVATRPEDFQAFLSNLEHNGFAGGNVTLPHKETAFESIQNLDNAARAIGAVNTIWIENGELFGSNTDAYGFSANMDDFAPQWRDGKTAVVLGAGGASRAIIHSLLEAGYEKLRIINRTLQRAEHLAERFGEKCSAHPLSQILDQLHDCDCFVNTTSIGMAGKDKGDLPDFSRLSKSAIVADIVYTPLETPFLKLAKDNKLKTVDGLGMLLHQAVPGFEKWFGVRPQVSPQLRASILELVS